MQNITVLIPDGKIKYNDHLCTKYEIQKLNEVLASALEREILRGKGGSLEDVSLLINLRRTLRSGHCYQEIKIKDFNTKIAEI